MNTTTPTPTPPSAPASDAPLTDAPRADAPLAELLPVQPGLGLEAEQSFLQFVVARYDGFFDSVHNKANFWLAFNTFALGGIIAGYKDFVVALCAGLGQRLLDGEMLLFVALNLSSTLFILAASMPYLKRKDSPVLPSVVFFVDVAESPRAAWHANLNKLTPTDVLRDHREQTHELAIGLSRKYRCLYRGGALLMGQVVVLGMLITTYVLTPPCPKPNNIAVPTPPPALSHPATPATTAIPAPQPAPGPAPAKPKQALAL